MAKNNIVKCRYCKKEIDKTTAYLVGQRLYYCSKECYELSQSKKNNIKTEPNNVKKKTSFIKLTDYILSVYLNAGYSKNQINWTLLMSQVSNMIKKHKNDKDSNGNIKPWKYTDIKYTLKYMINIKEMNLFNDDFNGSILNLVEFEYNNAKEYYRQTQEIKDSIKNFNFNDEVTIIKKNNKNILNQIDIGDL